MKLWVPPVLHHLRPWHPVTEILEAYSDHDCPQGRAWKVCSKLRPLRDGAGHGSVSLLLEHGDTMPHARIVSARGLISLDNEALITLIVLLVAIVGVGVSLALLIQNVGKESRREVNRLQDRVTDLDSSLRDRIAWIEGLLGAFTKPPDQELVYRWRGLGRAEPEEEN